MNNLKNLDLAKKLAAWERDLKPGTTVSFADLSEHLGRLVVQCPEGGEYTLGVIGVDATCSIKTHTKEEFGRQIARHKRQTRIQTFLQLGGSLVLIGILLIAGVALLRRIYVRWNVRE